MTTDLSRRIRPEVALADVDTTTPAGRALFQMMGVFAEFERAMIRERLNAGLARARAEGKTLGRPRTDKATEAAIRKALIIGGYKREQ